MLRAPVVTWRDAVLIAGCFSLLLLVDAIMGRWPPGYYPLLRVIVSVTALCLALAAFDWKRWEWVALIVLVVLLFNPFNPLITPRMQPAITVLSNGVAAVVIGYAALTFRRAPKLILKRAPSVEGVSSSPRVLRTTDTEAAIQELRRLTIPHQAARSEKSAESALLSWLEEGGFKGLSTQTYIGGPIGLKIDIDIGDGKTGAEVKLASSLLASAPEIHRLIGQAIYYDRKKYRGNLVVAVAGNPDDLVDQRLCETFLFLEDLGIACVGVRTT